MFICNFQLETKGNFYYIHTLYDVDNIRYQNGITTLYKRLYWTSRFLYNYYLPISHFFLRRMIKANRNVYWRIWSILHPFCSLNEKSCAFSSTLPEVKNRLWWRCNCMQEDTTPCSITIARRRQTLLRGTWNAGNRRSSPHQFIYYCIVKVKAKKASQSDYNYRSFLEEEEEKARKSLNLLCICFRKL